MSICRICGAEPCINRNFCRSCRYADAALRKTGRQRQSTGVSHPTSQATVEALMYYVRERGLPALQEPTNVERLTRCDAAAKAQIDQRIKKLIDAEKISND
jgi:hypothetical protein